MVSYSYTLVDNENHPTANGANSLTENFNVVATDATAAPRRVQTNVNIVDDLPTAHPDHASVAEGGDRQSGNVLDNDIGGADGPALSGAVVGVRAGTDTSTSAIGGLGTNINGTYGYLTLDANGNALYHSNPNAVNGPGATDVFTYTVRDADGDESTTTVTIDVSNSCIVAASDTDVTVFEKALDLTKDGQDLARRHGHRQRPWQHRRNRHRHAGRLGHRRQPARSPTALVSSATATMARSLLQPQRHLHLHPDIAGDHHAARRRRRQYPDRKLHLPGHRCPGQHHHQHHRGQHRRRRAKSGRTTATPAPRRKPC